MSECTQLITMSNRRKIVIGPGCRVNLPNILNNQDLIFSHMMNCEKCRDLVQICEACDSHFSSYSNYKQHIDRTNNEECRNVFNRKNQENSYCTTVVEIVQPNNDSNNDIESMQEDITNQPFLTDLEKIHKQNLYEQQ